MKSAAQLKAEGDARRSREERLRLMAERYERMIRQCVAKAEAARRLGISKPKGERLLKLLKGKP